MKLHQALLSLAVGFFAAAAFAQNTPPTGQNPGGQGPTGQPPSGPGGQRPMMQLPQPADPKLPTLWLIGDSTVRNGRGDGSGGLWGWGEPIVAYFDAAKLNVVNRAVGGLSSRTFLTGGQWDNVLKSVKAGDFVMMQFGHNDNGALNDEPPPPLRARGTIPGIGEETKEIDNVMTKQHEVVHSFGWYMRKFVTDAKAKGATPIVCSLIPRRGWVNGKAKRNNEDYALWAAQVAKAENVAFIDLNEIIARKHDALGEEKATALFGDSVHTKKDGAEMNAQSVIGGLKALKTNPLAPYFSDKAAPIAAETLAAR